MSASLDAEYLFLGFLLVVGTCWILFIYSGWKHWQSQKQINAHDQNIYSTQLYVFSHAGMFSSIIPMTLYLIILYPTLTTPSVLYILGHVFAEIPRGFILLYETFLFESTFHNKYPKKHFVCMYYIICILIGLSMVLDALVLLLHSTNDTFHLIIMTVHILTHILLFLLSILISSVLCHNIVLLFGSPKLPTFLKFLIFAISSITIILAGFITLHLLYVENISTIVITICEAAFIFMIPFLNSNYRYRKRIACDETGSKTPNHYQHKTKSIDNSSQTSKKFNHLSHTAEKEISMCIHSANASSNRTKASANTVHVSPVKPVVITSLHRFWNTVSTNVFNNDDTKKIADHNENKNNGRSNVYVALTKVEKDNEEASDEYDKISTFENRCKDVQADHDGERIASDIDSGKSSSMDRTDVVIGNKKNKYVPVKINEESDKEINNNGNDSSEHNEASISSFDKNNELSDNHIIHHTILCSNDAIISDVQTDCKTKTQSI